MSEEVDGLLLHQVEYPKTKDTGSMVNFYLYIFKLFPEHMVIAVKALVNQQFMTPNKRVKVVTLGYQKERRERFSAKGGRIIDWIDIFRFYKEN